MSKDNFEGFLREWIHRTSTDDLLRRRDIYASNAKILPGVPHFAVTLRWIDDELATRKAVATEDGSMVLFIDQTIAWIRAQDATGPLTVDRIIEALQKREVFEWSETKPCQRCCVDMFPRLTSASYGLIGEPWRPGLRFSDTSIEVWNAFHKWEEGLIAEMPKLQRGDTYQTCEDCGGTGRIEKRRA